MPSTCTCRGWGVGEGGGAVERQGKAAAAHGSPVMNVSSRSTTAEVRARQSPPHVPRGPPKPLLPRSALRNVCAPAMKFCSRRGGGGANDTREHRPEGGANDA